MATYSFSLLVLVLVYGWPTAQTLPTGTATASSLRQGVWSRSIGPTADQDLARQGDDGLLLVGLAAVREPKIRARPRSFSPPAKISDVDAEVPSTRIASGPENVAGRGYTTKFTTESRRYSFPNS